MNECQGGAVFSQMDRMKVDHIWSRSSWDTPNALARMACETFFHTFKLFWGVPEPFQVFINSNSSQIHLRGAKMNGRYPFLSQSANLLNLNFISLDFLGFLFTFSSMNLILSYICRSSRLEYYPHKS